MRWIPILLLALLPSAALAQDDDRSRLVRFLEDQLSADGTREVSIAGFRGVLSSEAQLDRMTIADADGVWLILEDVALVWTRSALLRGSLQIEQLTAARLEVMRPPLPAEGVDLPTAEAQPFSLPDLPVRVDIGEVSIAEVVLGEPLFGLPATLRVNGSARLAGGAGAANITLDRLDGPRGQFALQGAYDNATRNITLNLLLDEDEGGLVAELLGLPDRPDLRLTVAGDGPIEEFAATIGLATNGEDRITGSVVSALADSDVQVVIADIGGDISPLLAPEYREFFGDDVQLQAQVRLTPGAGTELEALRLSSAALQLEGDLAIDAQGLPERVALTGVITPPEGSDVRLPAGGVDAYITGANLALTYDRAEGETYSLTADLDTLVVDDLSVDGAALALEGAIALSSEGIEAATAQLNAELTGMAHDDPALAEALGEALGIGAQLSWVTGAPAILSDLTVVAGNVTAEGGASIQSGEGQLNVGLDIATEVGDLSRFAAISRQPLAGEVSLGVAGHIEALSGAFDLRLSGAGQELRIAEAVPEAIFAGETILSARAVRDASGVRLEDLSLESAEVNLVADADISSGDTSATTRFRLNNVGHFTEFLSGPVTIEADVNRSGTDPFDIAATLNGPNDISLELGGNFDAASADFAFDLVGSASDLDLGDAVPQEFLAGRTDLSATATRLDGILTLTDLALSNAAIAVTGRANMGPETTGAELDVRLADIGIFTEILSGPVTIAADLNRSGTDPFDIAATLAGPNEINVEVGGAFNPETTDFALDLVASAQDLDLGNAVPAQLLAGRTDLSATAARQNGVMTLTDLVLDNREIDLTGEASIGPEMSRADFTARLANVGIFTDALSGEVSADAAVVRDGDGPWQIDADLGGPGGMRAAVDGLVGLPDGAVDLSASGQAPMALANRYIRPRSATGTINFDIAMRGQPGLGALSGTVRSTDARLALPNYALAIQNVNVTGQLAGGQLNLDANGTISTGGQLGVQGNIDLGGPNLDANISATLRDGRLVDPTLYEARITSADLTVTGPLARGPQISGQVTLGESEIRVPESGLGGSARIPDIRHVGEAPEERLTRQFAGLLGRAGGGRSGSSTTGLDMTITAPGRIYLRGRGIDAEFGGEIRLLGTTQNIIPTGQFNMLRGRLSILGTRLDFTEGSATLQGSFDPFLRLVATSRASGYTITISIVGSASSPDISFSSDPSLPEDEVLAQLLFGRSVSNLSPLQLLQLADAAASLAGGSTNSGFIAGIREGLGLDDLDLTTDEEGNAAVTAGRYLSENIYTDVTINAEGEADLSLNIDLTPNVTARGSVGSDGSSSIGIFFEQDY